MARVQFVVPDEERDLFVRQARKEGMTLSAWLRTAAHQRLREQERGRPFESQADVEEFFRDCDALEGPAREPDWEEHLTVIEESRGRGASRT